MSQGTVSNVIHGRTNFGADVRERVLAAIDELGYQPNVSARSLKLQRTSFLGVVVGDLSDPYYAEVAACIERFAAAKGYTMLLASTGGDRGAEVLRVESLLQQQAAHVISWRSPETSRSWA